MSGPEDHEVLANAFAALREETASAGAGAGASAGTRRRILLAASARRRQRLFVLRIVVPMAAVLAIGTAWAAAGARFGASPETTREGGSSERESAANAPPTAEPNPPILDLDLDSDPDPDPDPSPDPPSPTAPGSSSGPHHPIVPAEREEVVYRAGHEAHFVARDPRRALAGWDAYLAAYPRGRFAPEARYNRALTLVRLGRKDEARAALEPFALATAGSYRQAEARALLEALQ